MKTNIKLLLLAVATGLSLNACNSGGITNQPDTASTVTSNNTKSANAVVTNQYEVVIDSGSKGNRIYLYKYENNPSLAIINEVFDGKNSTPLASFVNSPNDAGTEAILPLLTEAKEKLGELSVNPSNVNVTVMGTAGMRLISDSAQAAIWDSVTETVKDSGFKLQAAKTLDGQHEGVYSWVGYNYLNNLFSVANNTTGTIEIGGASAQIAYALPNGVSNQDTVNLTFNGNNYNVYSVSYLGLGVNQAREKANNLVPPLGKNPCYATGYNTGSIDGNFDQDACNNNFANVMSTNPDINNLRNTKELPGFATEKFAGLGAIWDSVQPLSKSIKKNAISATSFNEAVNSLCTMSYTDILNKFTDDDHADDAPSYCSTAIYVSQFLFGELAMNNGAIQGQNKYTTADGSEVKYNWTLGYIVTEHTI